MKGITCNWDFPQGCAAAEGVLGHIVSGLGQLASKGSSGNDQPWPFSLRWGEARRPHVQGFSGTHCLGHGLPEGDHFSRPHPVTPSLCSIGGTGRLKRPPTTPFTSAHTPFVPTPRNGAQGSPARAQWGQGIHTWPTGQTRVRPTHPPTHNTPHTLHSIPSISSSARVQSHFQSHDFHPPKPSHWTCDPSPLQCNQSAIGPSVPHPQLDFF